LEIAQPVVKWTGLEVRLLRQAMRMTVRDFAAYLGVSDRMVSKWEAGGTGLVPRPVNQAALDTCLDRASGDVRARFSGWPDPTHVSGAEPRRWVMHVVLDAPSADEAVRLADSVLVAARQASAQVGMDAMVAPDDRPLRGYRVSLSASPGHTPSRRPAGRRRLSA
jgi:transcriptional regulator with XRE-family HTH domain